MRLSKLILLLTLFTSSCVFASTFHYNYRNIHALSTLICAQVHQKKVSRNIILVNSIEINEIKTGPNQADSLFEISGSCGAQYNIFRKSFEDYGEELDLTIDRRQGLNIKGSLGLSSIQIKHKSGSPFTINFIEPLMAQTSSIQIMKANWAKSNSMLNLNKDNFVSVTTQSDSLKLRKRVLSLYGQNKVHIFKTWSSKSFGCSRLTESSCERLSKKLSI